MKSTRTVVAGSWLEKHRILNWAVTRFGKGSCRTDNERTKGTGKAERDPTVSGSNQSLGVSGAGSGNAWKPETGREEWITSKPFTR